MLSLSELGDVLFGRGLRLEVCAWVLNNDSELFFQSEVAKGVDYTASSVSQELQRLMSLGMIQRLPREAGERRQYYMRVQSPLWNIIRTAVEATDYQPSGESQARS